MQWVRAAPLSGTVGATSSAARLPARVVLVPAAVSEQLGGQNARCTLTPAGRFDFGLVPSGDYALTVNAGPAGWIHQPVQVESEAVHLDLQLQPPFTVSGRIEFRSTGRAEVPGDAAHVTVRLAPERLQAGSTMPTAQAGPDGSFTLRGVPGGTYRLRASSSAGWTQATGRLGEVDTLDVPVTVAGDRDDGLVVMVDQETAVLAQVTDNEGRPVSEGRVVIFPADRSQWIPGSRSVRVIRLSPTGTASVSGLPAGRYLIAVIPDSDQQPVNIRRLQSLSTGATPFVLAEGDQRRVPLRIR